MKGSILFLPFLLSDPLGMQLINQPLDQPKTHLQVDDAFELIVFSKMATISYSIYSSAMSISHQKWESNPLHFHKSEPALLNTLNKKSANGDIVGWNIKNYSFYVCLLQHLVLESFFPNMGITLKLMKRPCVETSLIPAPVEPLIPCE